MKKINEICFYSFNLRDFSAPEIADITGVDASTARRYRRQNTAPVPVLRLLAYHHAGFVMPDAYAARCRFEGRQLVLDTGERLSVDDLLMWWLQRQLDHHELTTLRARLARLQRLEVIRGTAEGLRLLEKAPQKDRQDQGDKQPKHKRAHGVGFRRVTHRV